MAVCGGVETMTTLDLIRAEKRYKAREGRLSRYYDQMRYQMSYAEYRTLQYGMNRVYRGSLTIYRELDTRPVREVMLARMQWRDGKR